MNAGGGGQPAITGVVRTLRDLLTKGRLNTVYCFTTEVPAPIEMYDALHAAVLEAVGGRIDGLLLHVGRPSEGGFAVTEVWESREQSERFNAEVAGPVMARLSGGQAGPPVTFVEHDVHGLILQGDRAWL